MGIFDRFRDTTLEPVPPTVDDVKGRITTSGKNLASKATQIYRENPKLVSGIALVASALLLNRMRRTPK
jgi:hypothetical protein